MAYVKEVYKCDALLAICRSKRLLSKHQEMLESICTKLEEPALSYRLARSPVLQAVAGCAGFVMPSLLGCSRRSSVVVAALAVPILATVGYNHLMYRKEKGALTGFMKELDAFDAAAARVFLYYEETSSYEHELLRATATRTLTICVRSMKAVVESLYDLGRSLESYTDLSKQYEHLYNLLEDRENFVDESNTDNEPEQLLLGAKKWQKVLYYLQSVCIYRWALAIASDSDFGKTRSALENAMAILKQSSEDMGEMFLPMLQERTSHTTTASNKIASLKSRTLALSTNLIVTQQLLTILVDTLELVAIDHVPDATEQLQVAADLLYSVRVSAESRFQEIIGLQSDVARLIEPQSSSPSTLSERQILEMQEDVESNMTFTDFIPNIMPGEDEFFVHTTSALDMASMVVAEHDNEEPPVEQVDKSTQRNYRTVLRQLHGKLQPIKQEFKVREQRALERKGITAPLDNVSVDDEEGEEEGKDSDAMPSSSLNSDDDDLSWKRTNYQQRYQDAKEQLAAKPKINLFPRDVEGFPPVGSAVEENILE